MTCLCCDFLLVMAADARFARAVTRLGQSGSWFASSLRYRPPHPNVNFSGALGRGIVSVYRWMWSAGIEPAPEREKKRTWKRFMKSHWDTLWACDFFSVAALGAFGTVRHMVFFVIELKSRADEIAGIAVDPGEEWTKQVARNLTDPVVSAKSSPAVMRVRRNNADR